MDKKIRFYEELSFNSHMALKVQFYDGWIIRSANGYTNRANSIGMLYPSSIDLETKISYCEEVYSGLRQPCVFKVTDDNEVDELLEQRGYRLVTPTHVMDMDLKDRQFEIADAIITRKVTEEWLQAYYELEHYGNPQIQDTVKQMLYMLQNEALYCRIVKDGKTIACASAVIERGYMALLNVIVDEQYRGYGYGKQLCEALLAKSKEVGAHTAYLQVVQNNKVAVNLYEKLGYRKIYSYWYRVKEMQS